MRFAIDFVSDLGDDSNCQVTKHSRRPALVAGFAFLVQHFSQMVDRQHVAPRHALFKSADTSTIRRQNPFRSQSIALDADA
jgi:hypothetical protein